MKKEHLAIVWDSCSEFEKANISFGEFLEKLGRAMESASSSEAGAIRELVRNLEFSLVSGSPDDISYLLDFMKRQVEAKIRSDL